MLKVQTFNISLHFGFDLHYFPIIVMKIPYSTLNSYGYHICIYKYIDLLSIHIDAYSFRLAEKGIVVFVHPL